MTRQAGRNSSIAIITLLLFARAAHADPPGPVRACVSDTQVGAGLNLAQALAAGGVVRFQCPAGTIIQVTGRHVLRVSTLIDGGDAITLDGHGVPGPMLSALQNVILRRLKVRNFAQKPVPPSAPGQTGGVKTIGRLRGSVINGFTDVELDHVSIETSDFPIDVHGIATVLDSTFLSNRGGLSLNVGGAAHIERTRFTGNGREVSMSAGWLRDCTFTGQTAGAVIVDEASNPVEIRHCAFSGIRGGAALRVSQRAFSRGPQTITIRDNVFDDNDSGAAPGAITIFDDLQAARDRGASAAILKVLAALPPAFFVLRYNRFTGNHGASGGAIAANLSHTQGMISVGELFVNNSAAGEGGAVMVSGGTLQMGHALFKGNRAGGRGAALAVAPDGSATLSNALVVANAGPAGAIAGNAISLVNVTIADNNAVGLLLETRAAQAANVLLARNHPADCSRIPTGVFSGGGMQSDGSCPGIPVGEAFLDAMYVPGAGSPALRAGSPALRAGDPAFCRGAVVRGLDLPFQSRSNSTSCAIGAFEGPPLSKFGSKSDHIIAHAGPEDNFPDDEGNQPGNSPPTGGAAYGSPTYGSPGYGSTRPASPAVPANPPYAYPPSYGPPSTGVPATEKSSKEQPSPNKWGGSPQASVAPSYKPLE